MMMKKLYMVMIVLVVLVVLVVLDPRPEVDVEVPDGCHS